MNSKTFRTFWREFIENLIKLIHDYLMHTKALFVGSILHCIFVVYYTALASENHTRLDTDFALIYILKPKLDKSVNKKVTQTLIVYMWMDL